MLPTKFQVNWPFVSGDEAKKKKKKKKKKKDFQDGRHILDFRSDRVKLFFDLQVAPMLPTKFQVD